MPECELVREPIRCAKENRSVAARLQPSSAAQQPGLPYAGRIRAGVGPFALLDRHRAERSASQGFPSARRSGASLTDAPLCSKAAEMRAKGRACKGRRTEYDQPKGILVQIGRENGGRS